MVHNSFFAFHISFIDQINNKKSILNNALLPLCFYFCIF